MMKKVLIAVEVINNFTKAKQNLEQWKNQEVHKNKHSFPNDNVLKKSVYLDIT